jgi:hypothetical protein
MALSVAARPRSPWSFAASILTFVAGATRYEHAADELCPQMHVLVAVQDAAIAQQIAASCPATRGFRRRTVHHRGEAVADRKLDAV